MATQNLEAKRSRKFTGLYYTVMIADIKWVIIADIK